MYFSWGAATETTNWGSAKCAKQTTVGGGVLPEEAKPTEQSWRDVDLRNLPHGNHSDTIFSNHLEKFYENAGKYFPNKMLLRQAFFKEKTRQWEITKQKEKNGKVFAFLGSDNQAAIGKRLDQGYVPKINYSSVIGEVGKRLVLLKTGIENLTKTHDQALFDNQGRHLKLDWTQFSNATWS